MTMVRIHSVQPLDAFHVRLTLTNGEVIERDLTHLVTGPVFNHICSDEDQFRLVQVIDGTLVWPSGADLCPDTIVWGGLPPSDSPSRAA